MKRCVNIDWLEVYCEESAVQFPCNADYYRKHGYYVTEREYGTRVYNEMFFLDDAHGNHIIEVRRNPASGGSSFKGLTMYSTHIRLTNATCYRQDAVAVMRDFLIRHSYIFHRIFRIDVCYDFERFDSGDYPAKVARRIVEKKLLKINQGRISVHGEDRWASYDWESLSWGSPSSMVSTKMYNKSKELKSTGDHKPYIYVSWMNADLITDPLHKTKTKPDGSVYTPEIWRIEFSIRSKADSWLIIEDSEHKKKDGIKVKHTLSMFDAPDKLWQRFQGLAFHYFRFKIIAYKKQRKGVAANALGFIECQQTKELQRKDRMPDKVLFKFDDNDKYDRVKQMPKENKPFSEWKILKQRLLKFKQTHPEREIAKSCDAIIDCIDRTDTYRYTPHFDIDEVRALQAVIQLKQKGSQEDAATLLKQILEKFKSDEVW